MMCIGVTRKTLPDWWDRVIELMNLEVFAGQMTAQQIEQSTALLRRLVELEDIFPDEDEAA